MSFERKRRDTEEQSISEFFKNNKEMLGYNKPVRSLTTIVHEAASNSLDECERENILPEIYVGIEENGDGSYNVVIEDNGGGVPKDLLPKFFGQMLAGTKFKGIQQRGQQGCGIAGSNVFAQMTTGNPMTVTTADGDGYAVRADVATDFEKNEGVILNSKAIEADFRGTKVEFNVGDVKYMDSKYGPLNYCRLTSIANPHAQITFEDPNGELEIFKRTTNDMPSQTKHHPLYMKPEELLALSKKREFSSIRRMIVKSLEGVYYRNLKQIEDKLTFDLDEPPMILSLEEAKELLRTLKKLDYSDASKAEILHPIGEENIEKELKETGAEFASALTRNVEVFEDNAFIIEVGIAYGGDVSRGLKVRRFANRVPLLFDKGVLHTASKINWDRYDVDPKSDKIDLFVSMVSTHVPYTSPGKTAVSEVPVIEDEANNAVKAVARKLRKYIKGQKRRREKEERRKVFEKNLSIIAEKASSLAGENASNPKDEQIQKLLRRIT